ncbi:MAG: helix-turn-helix domain-containing protein [Acidaminococcaceae bacterium]|nr:helix-turn-helix domain-containing protein [Acidaminococcaceae bacterium]MBQ9697161.1 helix-turn-helix domain-containing protein [Acidaminococcaceae bacterium]MBR1590853.1 helix-turn-helix domain-containing protein [Acidaminococcaceae bacterium]
MGKAKYSVEEKLSWVIRIQSNEISMHQVAKMCGIHEMTIQTWLRLYEVEGIQGLTHQAHNRSYPVNLKRMAVAEYLAGSVSLHQICKKYKIRNRSQLLDWIKRYNSGKDFGRKMSGGSRMKKTRKTSQEERIQIVKACMERGFDYGSTALEYKVSYQQVYTWVQKYKELGEAGLEDRRGKRTASQTPRTEVEELRIKIAQLEHEKYMLQMERDVLKKLDEIERRDAFRK